jgi:hypothetical protein
VAAWTIPDPWVEAGDWAGDDENELPGCTTANYVAIILAMISLFVSCVTVWRFDRPRNVVVVSENREDKFTV